MRHITQKGLDLIKRFEGFSSTVYICSAGYPTIGYGHRIKEGEKFTTLSETQAEVLLRRDIHTAERSVLRLIDIPLTASQFDALVSFTYNLGAGALQRSTLRRKANRELHGEVPAQLMRWVWAGGRKLKGLERRRQVESLIYIV